MTGHFLKRDLRDFLLWWICLVIITLLFGALAAWSPQSRDIGLLWWAYYMFAFFACPQLLGSVWRTQHQWSRHYLLALPISHRRLFAIQHARILMFWVPLVILSAAAPLLTDAGWRRFTTADWWLYYFGVPCSIAFLIEMQIWTTLDMERIAAYVPKGARLWVFVKFMATQFGVMGLLAVAWSDLLFLRTVWRSLHYLGPFKVLSYIYWPGSSYVLFPAVLVLSVLWGRHNARRWCVTL